MDESVQSRLEEVWALLEKARVKDARDIIEYIAFLLIDQRPFGFADYLRPRKPRAMYNVDDNNLKNMLKGASEIVQQKDGVPEELADAYLFDRYVLFYSARMGKDTYPIPRHIVDFMLNLLSIEPEQSFADFTCGSGGFLVNRDGKMVQHIGRTVGVEIAQDWMRIAATNVVLHGMMSPPTSLHTGNAFELCAPPQILSNDTFDRIAMAPAFGTTVDPELTHWLVGDNRELRSEVLFTLLALEKLNSTGQAAIMVPDGMVTRGGQSIRQRLVKERVLSAVIKLQSEMLEPFNDEQVSILLLDKEKVDTREQTWFFDVSNDGYPLLRSRNLLMPPPEEMRDQNDLPRVESTLLNPQSLMPVVINNMQLFSIKRIAQVVVIAMDSASASTFKAFRFFPPDAQQVSHLLVEIELTSNRTITHIDIPLRESDNVYDIVEATVLVSWRANLYPVTLPDEEPPDGRRLKSLINIENQQFAITYDGNVLGFTVPFSTIEAENYNLSMTNYELTADAAGEFQLTAAKSAAELLNTVRTNQRTVARHIDALLGRLEVPSIIGKSLPPDALKGTDGGALDTIALINDLGTKQDATWKLIKEHFIVDGKYALYFVSEDLEVREQEENGALDKVHIQHTLHLLECIGLIVQVMLQLSDGKETLTCYRCVTNFDIPQGVLVEEGEQK